MSALTPDHDRPENTLDDVVAALEQSGCRPKPNGNGGYQALCPVHEADGRGHTPSLSIAPGDRVAFVLTCHAGCPFEDIIKVLNGVCSRNGRNCTLRTCSPF